ncbi:hypothetical protein Q7P37_004028 [Cladosporium fusiforme]
MIPDGYGVYTAEGQKRGESGTDGVKAWARGDMEAATGMPLLALGAAGVTVTVSEEPGQLHWLPGCECATATTIHEQASRLLEVEQGFCDRNTDRMASELDAVALGPPKRLGDHPPHSPTLAQRDTSNGRAEASLCDMTGYFTYLVVAAASSTAALLTWRTCRVLSALHSCPHPSVSRGSAWPLAALDSHVVVLFVSGSKMGRPHWECTAGPRCLDPPATHIPGRDHRAIRPPVPVVV